MKRLLPFVVLTGLALPSGAQAASTFAAAGQFPAGDDPYGVVPADYNGDGRLDVAVINGTSSTVSLYLGQGNGTFVREGTDVATNPNTAGGPNWGVAGDFTGDGRIDLAVSNFVTNEVRILRREAGGGFTSLAGFDVPGATGVVAADFNGDSVVDLAATSQGANSVVVALGQGGGEFVAEQPVGLGTVPRNLATGDFNGDGRPDLAVADETNGRVIVLQRAASGTGFDAPSTVTVGARPGYVATADFNRDGRTDIAVSNYGSNTVQLLLRNAINAGFDAATPVSVPAGPIGLTVADFDANGTPDLAVASNVGAAVTVVSGGSAVDATLPAERAYGVASADFNGDGKPDIATTLDLPNAFASFLNTTATAQPPVQTPTPTPIPTPTPTPTLPDPVAGRTVNAAPVEGTVKVKLPRTNRYVDLAQADQLPVGTTVDARRGTVQITAAGKGGTAKFYDGIFKLSQTRGSRPLTTLTLTETLSCPKGGKASASAAKKKTRKLWGDGKGSFRTSGRYSAATVRGTKWLVQDRCDSTKTTVRQGAVSVRDSVKKKTVVVRAGKSYTARKKR